MNNFSKRSRLQARDMYRSALSNPAKVEAAEPSGILTLENWLPWAERELWETADHEEVFLALIKSEYIRQNFWSHPHIARTRVITQIAFGMPPIDAGAIMQLRMKVSDSQTLLLTRNHQTDSLKWLTDPSDSIVSTLRSHSEPLMKSVFEQETSRFMEFQKAIEVRNYGVGIDDVKFVTYLLKLLYGDTQVIEVMRAWQRNTVHHSLAEFIQLAHRWNDDVKMYPIEWTLNLMESPKEN